MNAPEHRRSVAGSQLCEYELKCVHGPVSIAFLGSGSSRANEIIRSVRPGQSRAGCIFVIRGCVVIGDNYSVRAVIRDPNGSSRGS